MKKLMIAFAAIAMAVVANAATYQWKSTSGYVYTDSTKSTKVDAMAYLFNVDTISQSALLDAVLVNGTDIATLSSVALAQMEGGRISETTVSYNDVAVGDLWNAYYAIVVDQNVYISTVKNGIEASELASGSPITFGTQTSNSGVDAIEWTAGSTANGGWYTAAAVPEPTSALMLLVGLAGLALKRKVA